MASRTRYARETARCPPAIPPTRMPNSLQKAPNGGEPVIARIPPNRRTPRSGDSRRIPWICRILCVPNRRMRSPATRNSRTLTTEWFSTCSSAAGRAAPPNPIPRKTIPMFSIEENASSRLMSRWTATRSAGTAIDRIPKRMIRGEAYAPGIAGATRRMERKAQFSRTPDSIADAGAGAWLCASGSHVCIGASPIFVPYPTRKNRNASRRKRGSSRFAAAGIAVYVSGTSPAARERKMIPRNAKAIPTEQMSRYFQAASIPGGPRAGR